MRTKPCAAIELAKALPLGEVAAAVRLRIAGFGEGTPQQDSDGTE